MALLQLNNFALSVGSSQLLEGVNARVVEGQRIALVGKNGCGKSTLLRALASATGALQPLSSSSSSAPSPSPTTAAAATATPSDYYVLGASGVGGKLAAGRRSADGSTDSASSISTSSADSVLLVEQDNLQWLRLFPDAADSEEEVRNMTLPEALDMAAADGNETALEDVEAWRRLAVAAQDALEWGTARYDTTAIGQLSPGSAVRAYLAVVLQRRNVKLVLLDEPTNHLDLPSIVWLQHAILASGKSVIVVSHEASFLDAVADHVWYIDADTHSLTVSGAGYSAFIKARQMAIEQQQQAYDAQQKRHKRLAAVADSLRAASAAGEHHVAKDRDKLQRDFKRDRAGRSGHKAKAAEARIEREAKVERPARHRPLRIMLEPVEPGTSLSTIMLDSVVLGYDGDALPLPPLSLRIDYGERVAIVGFNGVGKSTLLRTLVGGLQPLAGQVKVGRSLSVGNLMQEHESLPRQLTPRQHLSQQSGMEPFETGVRLMQYGLTRRQVDCPIGELNPGARARALLASFAMRSVNLLVLDEPTNHLDEEAVQEVIATLNDYGGTVIIVSHSRTFLDSVRLTRILRLSSNGLDELASFEDFVSDVEDAAKAVVAECF